MLIKPLTGVKKEEKLVQNEQEQVIFFDTVNSKKMLYDPNLERDIVILTKNYLRRSAVFDVLANFPVTIYLFLYGMPDTLEKVDDAADDVWFTIVMGLKTFRLFHL